MLHFVAAVGTFFAMEDNVKALEEKVAKLKAKLGKVKVRLVQVAIRRSPPQKICYASNQRAFVRRPAKVGWFGYGKCRSPEQVEF